MIVISSPANIKQYSVYGIDLWQLESRSLCLHVQTCASTTIKRPIVDKFLGVLVRQGLSIDLCIFVQ